MVKKDIAKKVKKVEEEDKKKKKTVGKKTHKVKKLKLHNYFKAICKSAGVPNSGADGASVLENCLNTLDEEVAEQVASMLQTKTVLKPKHLYQAFASLLQQRGVSDKTCHAAVAYAQKAVDQATQKTE